MSTPMRQGPSQQGQGRTPSQFPGAAPTPPVSTPFSNSQTQAAFSPPQGSRTSPQQVKKSPATSATLKGLSEGTAINFDSPSATAALGALGISGNLDLSMDAISMGTLGLGRADEDDRKKRMDALLHTLKAAAKGKVSKEGLERLTGSMGLEHSWEDFAKTLVIAGNGLSIDIVINNHVVENVTLALLEGTESVQKHLGKASDILLNNLKLGPKQSPLTKSLEKFRPNLVRLANLDKLSILPSLNCYDAIAGISESLLKLHNWDVQKLREDLSMKDNSEDFLKVVALCTRHGCPLMHTRDRVGLSLDYWKERRYMLSNRVEKEDIRTWSFLIDCAHLEESMSILPIRISDKWISDKIEKSNPTSDELISMNGPVLDWQEPDSTFLPSDANNKDEPSIGLHATDGPRLPEVIFMATFDPPLIVANSVAAQIYNIIKLPMPETGILHTFDALVFPIPPGTPYDPSAPRTITRMQPVSYLAHETPGQKNIKLHQNTLYIYKPVYGQVLSKIPFQHPKQLIAMLPSLRQYAFLSTLLSKSFKPKKGFPEVAADKPASKTMTTAMDDFDRFIGGSSQPESNAPDPFEGFNVLNLNQPLAVDITLIAHVPRLQIVFPFRSRSAVITIDIQPGGRVHILSNNIFGPDDEGDEHMRDAASTKKGKRREHSVEEWAKKLEIVEDIGMWCEYIKLKLEQG